MSAKFKSASKKGFAITFENGWTISVQFGWGNYCDNQNHPDGWKYNDGSIVESANAEIAIWDENDKWFTFNNNDVVKGWCTPNEVAEWIDKVSKW